MAVHKLNKRAEPIADEDRYPKEFQLLLLRPQLRTQIFAFVQHPCQFNED
jgi:hypothetical protein